MRLPIFRTLAALCVAGAAAAGCADAPTAAVPQEPSFNTAAPLSVTVSCVDTGALYSTQRFDCTATASGGSGTGYSFTWTGNASEYYDYGGTSKAWYPCQYVSGSYGYGYLSATAVAFDSNGSYKGATYNKQPC